MLRSAALASSVVASMPTVALHQARLRKSLQHPGEDRLVRLEIDQATRAGDRRMIRRCFQQHQTEKLAQGKRVRDAPRDRALRVQALEVADQQQPKVAPGRQAGPALVCVESLARPSTYPSKAYSSRI